MSANREADASSGFFCVALGVYMWDSYSKESTKKNNYTNEGDPKLPIGWKMEDVADCSI